MAGPKKSNIRMTALKSAASGAQGLPSGLQALKVVAKEIKEFRRQLFAILRRPRGDVEQKIQELQALLKKAKPELEKAFETNNLHPKDFGARTTDEFIEKFAALLANRRSRARTLRGFLKAVRRGYRHNINGEVFEWLVLNLRELQKDLRRWARFQCEHLNELGSKTRTLADAELERTAIKLVDGAGAAVRLNGKFGEPVRATDVTIIRPDGKRVKFVDLMYVAFEEARGRPTGRMSPAVMTEIKLPAAAKSAPEQIGGAVPRFHAADVIEMWINGEKVAFRPADVVFSTTSIPQSLVKAEKRTWGDVLKPGKSYSGPDRIATTDKGMGANIFNIPIAVAVSRLNALTELMLSGNF